MMHAFLLFAISKSSRTMRAPSPTYFCTSSDPMTRICKQLQLFKHFILKYYKASISAIGHRTGAKCFASTRRTVEQHSFGRFNPNVDKALGLKLKSALLFVNFAKIRVEVAFQRLRGAFQFVLCSRPRPRK